MKFICNFRDLSTNPFLTPSYRITLFTARIWHRGCDSGSGMSTVEFVERLAEMVRTEYGCRLHYIPMTSAPETREIFLRLIRNPGAPCIVERSDLIIPVQTSGQIRGAVRLENAIELDEAATRRITDLVQHILVGYLQDDDTITNYDARLSYMERATSPSNVISIQERRSRRNQEKEITAEETRGALESFRKVLNNLETELLRDAFVAFDGDINQIADVLRKTPQEIQDALVSLGLRTH